jgi:hypothetical protein
MHRRVNRQPETVAQVRKLTLATRNQDDFAASLDAIVNPWSGIERR